MISLCITTYNRYELLMESFAQVLDDDRISEIVIVDDCSDNAIFDKVLEATEDNHKIYLYRNCNNLGMSRNKAKAIECANNKWCILFDSDNIITPGYLDALLALPTTHVEQLNAETIYCPSFAKPQFNYGRYAGQYIDAGTAGHLMLHPMGECIFNTCNYMVNREEYLKVYQHNPEMKGTDTIWFNYLWLKAGNSFYVVPGMEYYHRVHDGSGFLADCDYNMRKAKEVKELIKSL